MHRYTSLFLLVLLIGCEKPNFKDFAGQWYLKEWSIDGQADPQCSALIKVQSISLNIEPEGEQFRFAGESFVNSYFGSFTVSNYKGKEGQLKTTGVGSTKKLGPPDLQNCEYGYLQALQAAGRFSLSQAGHLQLTAQMGGEKKLVKLLFQRKP